MLSAMYCAAREDRLAQCNSPPSTAIDSTGSSLTLFIMIGLRHPSRSTWSVVNCASHNVACQRYNQSTSTTQCNQNLFIQPDRLASHRVKRSTLLACTPRYSTHTTDQRLRLTDIPAVCRRRRCGPDLALFPSPPRLAVSLCSSGCSRGGMPHGRRQRPRELSQ